MKIQITLKTDASRHRAIVTDGWLFAKRTREYTYDPDGYWQNVISKKRLSKLSALHTQLLAALNKKFYELLEGEL